MNESAQPVDAHNATEPDLWGEHSGDFLRLQVLWSQRTHFSLVFAAVDQPVYRDALIKRLPGQRLDVSPSDSPMDWLARLQGAWAQGVTRVHTVFAEPPTDAWWQQANLLRERLAEAFPALLLLWLSDRAIDAAAHQAPDLWNWRETVLTFTQPPTWSAPALLTTRFSHLRYTDVQAVKQRLEDIQHYLQQGDADALSSAHLNLEAAQAYERLGQWRESEAAARAAEHTFLHAGNTRMAVLAKSQIADILQARGDLDEALRIRKDDVLPVLERLGDVRSMAIIQGQIADILDLRGDQDRALRIRKTEELPALVQHGDAREVAITQCKIAATLLARGNLEEALEILKNEVLPVFNRLEDIYSAAITQGKIADIAQAQGNLDEALLIREGEELPVLERVGDIREAAITKGKIADIVLARGDLDEALRIRKDEVLPTLELLGDVREVLVARANLAQLYWQKDRVTHADEARHLLALALRDAQRLGLPEAQQILALQAAIGFLPQQPAA